MTFYRMFKLGFLVAICSLLAFFFISLATGLDF
jgi:hypothetical protein